MASHSIRSNASNVQLPADIKCKTCLKVKKTTFYSNKSLNDLKSAVARYGRTERILTTTADCTACKSAKGPKTEVQCARCDRYRTRACFSASSLRRGDDAICWDCQKDIDSIEPGADEDVNDHDDSDDSSSSCSNDSFDSDDDVSSMAQTMRATSLASSSVGGVALPSATASSTGYGSSQRNQSTASSVRPASSLRPAASSRWARVRAAPSSMPKTAAEEINHLDNVEVDNSDSE